MYLSLKKGTTKDNLKNFIPISSKIIYKLKLKFKVLEFK